MKPYSRYVDEFRQLEMLGRMRNVLLAEIAVQRLRQWLRGVLSGPPASGRRLHHQAAKKR